MTKDDFNFFRHFSQQYVAQPDKVLLETERGKAWTFAEIDRESARLARFLSDEGCRPGDRVSVLVKKSPEALCLYLACLRAGFVFHPLNTAYQSSELEYFLDNAAPAIVVCDGARERELRLLTERLTSAELLTLNGDGSGSLSERSGSTSDRFDIMRADEDTAAALLYSSGTTGVPKGIVLTHQNLLHNGNALVSAWGFTDQDVLLHALPFFHVHGLFISLSCVLLSGASMRWLPGFDVDQVIEFLPECTVMMGVPTYYVRLLAAPEFTREIARNIRLFVSGSAPLLEDTFRAFEARTGHRILERYGMTETNVNTSNPLEGERKPGSVGLPLPGVEVRVVDSDGVALPVNEIGNIEVHGPNVFREYWGMPERTAEDFTADGFFKTGDTGYIDADGYVSIVGRAKDMIISGGFNVYPIEIESVLNELPGIRESAVIGVPHADFGEGVVAIVVPREGAHLEESQIAAQLRGRLANFKLPKRILLVGELPRNTMGKVQKNQLRDACRNLLS